MNVKRNWEGYRTKLSLHILRLIAWMGRGKLRKASVTPAGTRAEKRTRNSHIPKSANNSITKFSQTRKKIVDNKKHKLKATREKNRVS